MKSIERTKRRKRISIILAIAMLATVFGDCTAVLAATQPIADDAAVLQQETYGQPDDEAYGAMNDAANDGARGLTEGTPAPVSIEVKAETEGRQVSVSWDPVEGEGIHYGVGYSFIDGQVESNLYDPVTTQEDLKVESDQFTDTSLTVSDLTYFNHYTFTVTAYDGSGTEVATGTVVVTPKMSTPPQAKSFKIVSGKGKVTMKWKKIAPPSDDSDIVIWYRIYRNGKLVKKQKDTGRSSYSWKDPKSKMFSAHKYTIRTVYRKDTPGQMNTWKDADTKKEMNTNYALVLGKKHKTIKRGPIRPIKYNFTLSTTAPYYTTYKGMSVAGHLKKGKKTYGTGALNTRFIIKVGKNTRWLPVKYTKKRKADYINGKKDYYTKAEKEAYVNARKIKSSTSYMIWISAYTQRVTVFKRSGGKWKQHGCSVGDGNYICSTGGLATPTPTGQLHIWSKLRTRHGHTYWSNFYSYTALHTCPSYAKGMGYPASHGGCVRVDKKVAKWLYETVPVDTRVFVY